MLLCCGGSAMRGLFSIANNISLLRFVAVIEAVDEIEEDGQGFVVFDKIARQARRGGRRWRRRKGRPRMRVADAHRTSQMQQGLRPSMKLPPPKWKFVQPAGDKSRATIKE